VLSRPTSYDWTMLAGASFLLFGLFMPIVRLPGGTVSYLWGGEGLVLLLLVVLITGLVLSGFRYAAAYVGIAAAILMCATLLRMVGIVLQTQVEYAQIGSIAAGFARNTDLGWGWLPLMGGAALIIWGGFTAPVRLTQTDAATDYLDASKIGVKEPALEGNQRTHPPAPQASKAFGRRQRGA